MGDVPEGMKWHKTTPPKAPMRWQDRALCRGTADPRCYDRLDRQPTLVEVKRVQQGMKSCRKCPVIAECLAFGIKCRTSGVYGGRYLVGGIAAEVPRSRSHSKIKAA